MPTQNAALLTSLKLVIMGKNSIAGGVKIAILQNSYNFVSKFDVKQQQCP